MTLRYETINKWASMALIISVLLGCVLLIIAKFVYELAQDTFIPILCVLLGLLILGFIWYRHQQTKPDVEIDTASHDYDVYAYQPGMLSSHTPPQAIDGKGLSTLRNSHRDRGYTAPTEMDAAPSTVLARFDRLTSRPRCNTISNRTTISTTLGVYGEIEPPLPVVTPLQLTFIHGEKQNFCIRPREMMTSVIPTPSRCRSSKSYRPLSASPCASTRTSSIIEMYAESEQRSGASAERTVDRNEDRIRSGTPF